MNFKTNYILTFVLVLIFGAVNAQKSVLANYNSKKSKKLSSRAQKQLKRDASRLALRLVAGSEDLRYVSISIPNDESQNIYKVLKAVSTSSSEAAKKIKACKIHVFPNPAIDNFTVIFDKDVAWAEPIRKGIMETKNAKINELLNRYDLVIAKHVKWDNQNDAITIRSSKPFNMSALSNEFMNIKGVSDVEAKAPTTDGNDIEITRLNGKWKVTYILKWGTCIDGCDNTHRWVFNVSDTYKVKFIKESGDDIPSWMRCDSRTKEKITYSK